MTIELQRFHHWAKENGIRSRVVAKESLGKGTGLFLTLAEKDALLKEQQRALSGHRQSDDQSQEEDNLVEPLLFIPRHLLLSKSRVFELSNCEPLQKTYQMLGGYENVTERMSLLLFLVYERLAVHERNRKEALRCEQVLAKAAALALESSRENGTKVESAGDDIDDDDDDHHESWNKDILFEPYIAVLPDISTPVTLSTEIVQGYLAGTLLLDSVCAKRARLEAEYENLSGARGIFEHWEVHPTLDDYIWADATFWSRVLSFQSQRDYELATAKAGDSAKAGDGENMKQQQLQDDMHLVPFLDFANHATKPNIRWHVDESGLYVLPHFCEEEEDNFDKADNTSSIPVQIPVNDKEDKPTPHSLKETHQELYLSYGDKPNMELLFLYGFMLSNNPVQLQTVAMPMDEDDPYYMPKAHTLMRMGLLPRVTLYLDTRTATEELIEICPGLWITEASRDLIWIYCLNEEDGLGVEVDEPDLKVCRVHDSASMEDDSEEAVDEADLEDEDEFGRFVLTIKGQRIETRKQLHDIVPTLDIYPVLVLRLMVMLGQRLEYYITRITHSGDKVTKTEGIEIVRAVHYDSPQVNPSTPVLTPVDSGTASPEQNPPSVPAIGKIRLDASSRLGYTLGGRDSPGHQHHRHHVAVRPCKETVAIEQEDEGDPLIKHQMEVEAQVSTLVQIMKAYRHEELQMLIQMSDKIGEGQVHYLENNTAVQEYLARMQAEEVAEADDGTKDADGETLC
ncbi:hypothetical protein BGW42_008010 [Actinomortierella wolfii]|nr:hypothetical protein BGW42_008010 [Actinomortierella wolfii]